MEALCQLSYSPSVDQQRYRSEIDATPSTYVRSMDGTATPNARGARTEAAVASALVRVGAEVYLPAFGSYGRVDLVYELDGRLVRVQCKTACRIGETLRFWTCSNTGNTPISYSGQVDEFGVYSPDTEMVYLVPAVDLPTRACSLRLAPTRNGQQSGVRWAKDFELGPP